MKKPEPNLFAPTAAWRNRQRLGTLLGEVREWVTGAEAALKGKRWADVTRSIARLQSAAIKASLYYYERHTADAVAAARARRKERRINQLAKDIAEMVKLLEESKAEVDKLQADYPDKAAA